jgi:Holliday junction resolvase
MTINSRAKGCRGEREWRDFLKGFGYAARRGQQFAGGGDSPDVISDVPGTHWEVKRVEAGNPYKWLDQAIADAKEGNVPIVAHRRSKREWICVIRAEDLIALLKKGTL